MVLCCCGCITKPCSLCVAGSLAARHFFGVPLLRFGNEIRRGALLLWMPHKAEPPKPATPTAPSASWARKTGGGAVRHRRQDGEVGTWTCPDCRRVISDCPTSRDQHMTGVYHSASLLRNEGFHRDFSKCQTEILNRMVAQHSLHQMAQHGPQAVPT